MSKKTKVSTATKGKKNKVSVSVSTQNPHYPCMNCPALKLAQKTINRLLDDGR